MGEANADKGQIEQLVGSTPLFEGVRAETLSGLLAKATKRKIKRGETLFESGEPSQSMYAVLSGRMRVWTVSAAGAEVNLNFLDPGAMLGEVGLLDGGDRTASVSAAADAELLIIGRREFFEALEQDPRLARNTVLFLCERLRWVSGRLEDSALRTAPERLARMLEHLMEDFGRKTDDGVLIDVKLNQTDLARWTMISRESLNKTLSRWASDGLLRLSRAEILVLDPEAISEIAELGEG